MLLAAPMLISTLYLQWGYSTMFMPICNYNLTKVIDTTLLPLSSKSGSLNAASNYAFAHGKTSSNQTLHRGMYEEFVETILTGWWTTCLEILPARERARGRF